MRLRVTKSKEKKQLKKDKWIDEWLKVEKAVVGGKKSLLSVKLGHIF